MNLARTAPAKVLAAVLGLHVLVWTLLPIAVTRNLQLDLVEDLALGREWQLGYWKHPPLPWWVADLVYRLTGQINSVYILGPLAAALCLYGVWLLARDIVGPFQALIAVLALEGVHFYNFSVVKFAHDQMQLPFLGLYRTVFLPRPCPRTRARLAAGRRVPGRRFWSKYAASRWRRRLVHSCCWIPSRAGPGARAVHT